MEDFKILSKSRRLLVYAEKYIILSIPKVHKVYRDVLLDNLINLNSNIIKARITNGKIKDKYFVEVLTNISMIDLIMSILMDLNLVEPKRFMSFVNGLNDCRKLILFWQEGTHEKEK